MVPPPQDTYRSAIHCPSCMWSVPLDLTMICVEADEPVIGCPHCGASVPVPAFGSDDSPGEPVAAEPAAEPRPLINGDDGTRRGCGAIGGAHGDACPGGDDGDDGAGTEPSSDPADEAVLARGHEARAERRVGGRTRAMQITCRACGGEVPLDPDRMRLTVTHATLQCPSCEVELRVRREDAFRGADPALAWSFAVYATEEATPEPEPEPDRVGAKRMRWAHLRRE